MKLLPIVLAATVLTSGASALAQQATHGSATKAECEKAGLKWDPKGGKDGNGACSSSKGADAGPAKGSAKK
jgi:hypothetical protein